MNWLPNFKNLEQTLTSLGAVGKEELAFQIAPHYLAEVMSKYFRMTLSGTENLPKNGPALMTPNHSGYSGFDAFLLGHHVQKASGRQPQILTHKLWFASESTGRIMERLGFIEATTNNGLSHLVKGEMVVLFPEGEYGNFKPTLKRYHLQKFKRGFVRTAIRSQSPIIPTLILGAEETHINLARLKITKYLKGRGLLLPLPLNIIPLPAKWHIHFMKPIYLPYTEDQANNS